MNYLSWFWYLKLLQSLAVPKERKKVVESLCWRVLFGLIVSLEKYSFIPEGIQVPASTQPVLTVRITWLTTSMWLNQSQPVCIDTLKLKKKKGVSASENLNRGHLDNSPWGVCRSCKYKWQLPPPSRTSLLLLSSKEKIIILLRARAKYGWQDFFFSYESRSIEFRLLKV